MRSLFLLLISLTLAISGLGLNAQSQLEMNVASGADLEAADAQLNRIYRKVLAKNADNATFCANLKEAQRAWLKFVDYHLKTVFPLNDGEDPRVVYGSIYPTEFANTKTALINQRIQQLESLSQDGME